MSGAVSYVCIDQAQCHVSAYQVQCHVSAVSYVCIDQAQCHVSAYQVQCHVSAVSYVCIDQAQCHVSAYQVQCHVSAVSYVCIASCGAAFQQGRQRSISAGVVVSVKLCQILGNGAGATIIGNSDCHWPNVTCLQSLLESFTHTLYDRAFGESPSDSWADLIVCQEMRVAGTQHFVLNRPKAMAMAMATAMAMAKEP